MKGKGKENKKKNNMKVETRVEMRGLVFYIH